MTSNRRISPLGAVVCFFRNHDVTVDFERRVWICERCGDEGEKLWMTGAWFVRWLRHDAPRSVAGRWRW